MEFAQKIHNIIHLECKNLEYTNSKLASLLQPWPNPSKPKKDTQTVKPPELVDKPPINSETDNILAAADKLLQKASQFHIKDNSSGNEKENVEVKSKAAADTSSAPLNSKGQGVIRKSRPGDTKVVSKKPPPARLPAKPPPARPTPASSKSVLSSAGLSSRGKGRGRGRGSFTPAHMTAPYLTKAEMSSRRGRPSARGGAATTVHVHAPRIYRSSSAQRAAESACTIRSWIDKEPPKPAAAAAAAAAVPPRVPPAAPAPAPAPPSEQDQRIQQWLHNTEMVEAQQGKPRLSLSLESLPLVFKETATTNEKLDNSAEETQTAEEHLFILKSHGRHLPVPGRMQQLTKQNCALKKRARSLNFKGAHPALLEKYQCLMTGHSKRAKVNNLRKRFAQLSAQCALFDELLAISGSGRCQDIRAILWCRCYLSSILQEYLEVQREYGELAEGIKLVDSGNHGDAVDEFLNSEHEHTLSTSDLLRAGLMSVAASSIVQGQLHHPVTYTRLSHAEKVVARQHKVLQSVIEFCWLRNLRGDSLWRQQIECCASGEVVSAHKLRQICALVSRDNHSRAPVILLEQ